MQFSFGPSQTNMISPSPSGATRGSKALPGRDLMNFSALEAELSFMVADPPYQFGADTFILFTAAIRRAFRSSKATCSSDLVCSRAELDGVDSAAYFIGKCIPENPVALRP